MDGHTEVHIRGPLPADILGTLLQVIGSTYPSARIGSGSPGDALTLLIPDGERPESPETPTGQPLEMVRLDPTGISFSTPHELRLAAEEELEQANAEIARLRAALGASDAEEGE